MYRDTNQIIYRRKFLQTAGTVGAITTSSALGSAQTETSGEHHGEHGHDASGGANQTTLIFGGEVSHWFGLAPESIHGKENPQLQLKPGTEYELAWINLDGEEHQFQILDANGKVLEESGETEEETQTVRFRFTATDQMRRYRCKYHPQSMQGQIRIGGGKGANGTTTGSGG